MPERTPLRRAVFGEIKHADYTVVQGLLREPPRLLRHGQPVSARRRRSVSGGAVAARPLGLRPPREHRVEFGPGRAINLARQGFVVFTYDMVGYNDSRQLPHTFGGQARDAVGPEPRRPAAVELDPRAGLPRDAALRAARRASAVTGESGGGTQTFLLAAVDDRVAVAAPVNMISLHMQGGCLCENLPGAAPRHHQRGDRGDDRAAAAADGVGDRRLDGEHARSASTRRCAAIYALLDAAPIASRPCASQAEHNYNKDTREAMYAWMARWLQRRAGGRAGAASARSLPTRSPICSSSHGRALPEAR